MFYILCFQEICNVIINYFKYFKFVLFHAEMYKTFIENFFIIFFSYMKIRVFIINVCVISIYTIQICVSMKTLQTFEMFFNWSAIEVPKYSLCHTK